MEVSALREYYGEPYNYAYYEIKHLLAKFDFYWIQGSTYLVDTNDLSKMFLAIEALKRIDWFRKSVRDIRGYRVEDWSNFTDLVKNF